MSTLSLRMAELQSNILNTLGKGDILERSVRQYRDERLITEPFRWDLWWAMEPREGNVTLFSIIEIRRSSREKHNGADYSSST